MDSMRWRMGARCGLADLVLALGPDVNAQPKIHDCGAELLACISLVGQQGFPATAPAAPEKLQSTSRSSRLGEVRQNARVPSVAKMACKRTPQKWQE